MPLRATLLYLSRNRKLRSWAERSGLARSVSSRFIAGRTLDDALEVCRRIRAEGITATLDYLGENVRSLDEEAVCRDMYIRALHALYAAGLEPNVSLKLTQFGIDFSLEACEANVSALVQAAAAVGGFVRIDMEGSAYTDRTLDLVRRVHRQHGACGTVIQAYLRRSPQDVASLIHDGIRVRLCKGAYLEPPELAFRRKADVDAAYTRLAELALSHDGYTAIATHDPEMIAHVEAFAAAHGLPKRGRFEFQMLYGIAESLAAGLVQRGYRVRLSIPYGAFWFPYLMRRLAERPANLAFFLRNAVLPR